MPSNGASVSSLICLKVAFEGIIRGKRSPMIDFEGIPITVTSPSEIRKSPSVEDVTTVTLMFCVVNSVARL